MRIPQAAERLKEAPAQALRAVLSKDAPAQQALRAVLSREAPAHALRAVFSGVGQVLLVTERVRRRAMGDDRETAAPAAPGVEGAPAAAEAEAGPAVTEAAAGTATAETAAPAAKTAEPEAGPEATVKPADRKTTPDKPRASKASTSTAKSGTNKASTARPSTAKASAPKPSASKAGTAKAGTAKAGTAKAGTAKASPAKADSAKSAETASPKAPAADPGSTPPIPHYSELTVASLRARMRGLDAIQLRGLISYERAHEDRETVIAMFERRIAKLDAEGPAGPGPAAG